LANKFNQPLSHFNTSKVTNMGHMLGANSFNQPLSSFDTSKVTSMGGMFSVRSARALTPKP
jgi:surface protein